MYRIGQIGGNFPTQNSGAIISRWIQLSPPTTSSLISDRKLPSPKLTLGLLGYGVCLCGVSAGLASSDRNMPCRCMLATSSNQGMIFTESYEAL